MTEQEISEKLKAHESRISYLETQLEHLYKWYNPITFCVSIFFFIALFAFGVPSFYAYTALYKAEKCFEHTKEVQCFFKDK